MKINILKDDKIVIEAWPIILKLIEDELTTAIVMKEPKFIIEFEYEE